MHLCFPKECFDNAASKLLVEIHSLGMPLNRQEKWLTSRVSPLDSLRHSIGRRARGYCQAIPDAINRLMVRAVDLPLGFANNLVDKRTRS